MFSVECFTLFPLHLIHIEMKSRRAVDHRHWWSLYSQYRNMREFVCFFFSVPHWNLQSKNKYHQPVCVFLFSELCWTKSSVNINLDGYNMQRSGKNFWHGENHIVCKCCECMHCSKLKNYAMREIYEREKFKCTCIWYLTKAHHLPSAFTSLEKIPTRTIINRWENEGTRERAKAKERKGDRKREIERERESKR